MRRSSRVSAEEATGQLQPDENEARLQALNAALKDAEARAKASEAKAKELQTKLTEYVRHLCALYNGLLVRSVYRLPLNRFLGTWRTTN